MDLSTNKQIVTEGCKKFGCDPLLKTGLFLFHNQFCTMLFLHFSKANKLSLNSMSFEVAVLAYLAVCSLLGTLTISNPFLSFLRIAAGRITVSQAI